MSNLSEIERIIRDGQQVFKLQLALASNDSARRLAAAYNGVLVDIAKPIREFRAIAGEKGMTTQKLGDEAAFIRLRDQFGQSLDGMEPVIRREAEQMQTSGIQAGLATGANALEVTLGSVFELPNPQDVPADYTENPAFQENTKNFGQAHSDYIAGMIAVAFAMGKGPQRVANEIEKYTQGFPLADAFRMTRTVGLWSQRQGAHSVFRANSDVVRGWVWSCALDGHTCMSCWAMQGTFHNNSEVLNDHHLGRCAPIPVTTSWADFGFEDGIDVTMNAPSGEDYFKALTIPEQKKRMGAARWAAWKDGMFDFSELSTTYADPVYGTMRKAASLDNLIGKEAAALYKRKAA
jgi:hypothetical protein